MLVIGIDAIVAGGVVDKGAAAVVRVPMRGAIP